MIFSPRVHQTVRTTVRSPNFGLFALFGIFQNFRRSDCSLEMNCSVDPGPRLAVCLKARKFKTLRPSNVWAEESLDSAMLTAIATWQKFLFLKFLNWEFQLTEKLVKVPMMLSSYALPLDWCRISPSYGSFRSRSRFRFDNCFELCTRTTWITHQSHR